MISLDKNLDSWNIKNRDLLNKSIESTDLREDMFQIERNNILIDSGWYEGSESFITFLIIDYNWEDPFIKIKSYVYSDCIKAISFCIEYAESVTLIKTC